MSKKVDFLLTGIKLQNMHNYFNWSITDHTHVTSRYFLNLNDPSLPLFNNF